ncbi:kinase-like domain-containing protein [Xylariaceae sp. FL0255]|nr:kinase-like domain-containing protein [Xylariaceae sp. FL0255]
MDSYVRPTLPYYGPYEGTLPSYKTIVSLVARGEAKVLDQFEKPGRYTVQIGEEFIVKHGKEIDLVEGENMLLVKKYTNIPIPELYAMYEHEPSGNKVLIMEYVKSQPLSELYDEASEEQKAAIGIELRRYLRELRNIPTPGYYGLPGARPYLALPWIFKQSVGPFESDEQFLDAYFYAQFGTLSTVPKIKSLKKLILEKSRAQGLHTPVFSHCDLQVQNIMLKPDGSLCIIDWEAGSFCPQYFEFFIYRFYELAAAGQSPTDNNNVVSCRILVDWILEAWKAFLDINIP